ncbi:hypothetical protein EJ110_NYTH33204 [Nymphaea thermarum]|nr:hypothetical protein EJ110_NYTH33204 [Nymphaea thermarum]
MVDTLECKGISLKLKPDCVVLPFVLLTLSKFDHYVTFLRVRRRLAGQVCDRALSCRGHVGAVLGPQVAIKHKLKNPICVGPAVLDQTRTGSVG